MSNIAKTTNSSKKRIAIIGSGISGLTCAHYLVKDHDVTIFEANEYLGGHVNTIDVEIADTVGRFKKSTHIETSAIDTGFIVFNERTYPNFFRLLDELNVAFQKTDMSFSVKNPTINFEYNGHTLNSLVSQRKNILSPSFWRFATDILSFNKHIKQLRQSYQQLEQTIQELTTQVANTNSKRKVKNLTKQLTAKQAKLDGLSSQTLGDYLATQKYGKLFEDNYLLPMVSAIWSMGLEDSKSFPLIFFAQFFDNHGLLDVVNRPQWFTIQGGSKQYVNKLVKRYAKMGGKALVNSPVQSVQRMTDGVSIAYQVNQNMDIGKNINTDSVGKATKTAKFDEVIFACHADVAKRLLTDISEQEQQVLEAFNFTDNQAILHTDTSVLPNKPLAWASWNYLLNDSSSKAKITDDTKVIEETHCGNFKPVLTYHMNILQRLVKKHNYLVTLNEPVNELQVIKHIDYRHPVYDVNMTMAQKRWEYISGDASVNQSTHFAGAYWFNGFHEDGVRSALRVCASLGVNVDILDKVDPSHLNNTIEPHPIFTYKNIPSKAHKNKGGKNRAKLNKRQVQSATTNTQLNQLFS
ncbi:FAD-dependent oxidoreductase [Psychrobacter sp. HD31]|uniref:NAD(P)/FAD-dependent oxidoreductase n=1 Tax=Psychrobacter sp. HD31 TaxID=3112003 RepID=UPI003DA4D218